MARFNIVRDGAVHVADKKCTTCIYRRNGDEMISQEARETMEAKAAETYGATIPCHDTYLYGGTEHAICRGFFDVHKDDVNLLTLADRMGYIRYVPTDLGRPFEGPESDGELP